MPPKKPMEFEEYRGWRRALVELDAQVVASESDSEQTPKTRTGYKKAIVKARDVVLAVVQREQEAHPEWCVPTTGEEVG